MGDGGGRCGLCGVMFFLSSVDTLFIEIASEVDNRLRLGLGLDGVAA